jgi:excisionase family DNA binding protein
MPDENRLLTVKEAASFLNVSINTVRMWIWQKRIDTVRLGRSVRIPKKSIEDILTRNYQKAERAIAL